MESEFIVVCCECKSVKDHRGIFNKALKMHAEHYEDDRIISHGYCEECFNKYMDKIYNEKLCTSV